MKGRKEGKGGGKEKKKFPAARQRSTLFSKKRTPLSPSFSSKKGEEGRKKKKKGGGKEPGNQARQFLSGRAHNSPGVSEQKRQKKRKEGQKRKCPCGLTTGRGRFPSSTTAPINAIKEGREKKKRRDEARV